MAVDTTAPPLEVLDDSASARAFSRQPCTLAHPGFALRRVLECRRVGDRLFVELRTSFHFSSAGASAQWRRELEDHQAPPFETQRPRLVWIESTANPVRTLAGLTLTQDRSSIEIHAFGCGCSRCRKLRSARRPIAERQTPAKRKTPRI